MLRKLNFVLYVVAKTDDSIYFVYKPEFSLCLSPSGDWGYISII